MGYPGDIHNPPAFTRLDCRARFKVEPADFQVTEQLGFEPGAVGEHLYLQIEKVASETLEVAERLAVFYGVGAADVGFAGFKDKRAVTRQWFSIRTVSDLAPAAADRLRVVARGRHHKKLRRGAHAANDFVVRLRDVRGAGWQARLAAVQARGVPNYFGPQRFAAGAVARAQAWLLSRGRRPGGLRGGRGWYLSVLRSYLFNTVLGRRVQAANWDRLIDGDVAACVDGCGAMPTGPLWGRGRSPACRDAAEVERSALAGYADICHGLEFAGLQQDRRSLILRPRGLQWRAFGEDVQLRFGLDRGGYATSLLREVFMLESMSDADSRIGFAGAARGV